ncbi:MAG: ribosomal L7Ae/L30e/S12e/Gadd45 family protein [Clostridiales bacterium]|nr:ribosomal L7Ae/L30e/S12e/Gadd45 family protein [Clostridiales bacterium]
MISQLKTGKCVVGLKQTRKAVASRRAERVFYALDADPAVTDALLALCRAYDVPCEAAPSMRELGQACGIKVGAAAAALVRPSCAAQE